MIKRTLPLLLLLSGCMVGPNYERHQMELSSTFVTDSDSSEPLSAWWRSFQDPLLEKLIQEAFCYNLDIQQAEERIKELRGERRTYLSYAQPVVDADVSASQNAFGGGFTTGAGPGASIANFDIDQGLFFAGFDVFWEIDLFGGTRRRIQAATARVYSAIERKRAVQLIVFADLATNYLEFRTFQREIALYKERIALLEERFSLTKERLDVGVDPATLLLENESELASLKARLPSLETYALASAMRVSRLTGRAPEELLGELYESTAVATVPEAIATGIPCSLINRRPDIREAEENLKAATAEVGASIADLFPSFTLFGNGGYQAITFGNITNDKIVWAGGLDLFTPVFHGGALRGNIYAAKARALSALYAYRESVLKALEEVENGLKRYSEEKRAYLLLYAASTALNQKSALTFEKQEVGLANRLQYLLEREAVLAKESELLESQARLFSSSISLYKALGGGWESFNSN